MPRNFHGSFFTSCVWVCGWFLAGWNEPQPGKDSTKHPMPNAIRLKRMIPSMTENENDFGRKNFLNRTLYSKIKDGTLVFLQWTSDIQSRTIQYNIEDNRHS